MPNMTIAYVINNRNIWHTIATLPPRDTKEPRVKSTPTKADMRAKAARDAIYDKLERFRIEREFAL